MIALSLAALTIFKPRGQLGVARPNDTAKMAITVPLPLIPVGL